MEILFRGLSCEEMKKELEKEIDNISKIVKSMEEKYQYNRNLDKEKINAEKIIISLAKKKIEKLEAGEKFSEEDELIESYKKRIEYINSIIRSRNKDINTLSEQRDMRLKELNNFIKIYDEKNCNMKKIK